MLNLLHNVSGFILIIAFVTKIVSHYLLDKISFVDKVAINSGTIKFTINDQGFVSKASIGKTTKNANVYMQLIDAIKNMPRWKPAEDAQGSKVSQDFILTVGNGGC